MLRASLLVLAGRAFDLEGATLSTPTEDPEDSDIVLLDEYASDSIFSRPYRNLYANATNTSPPLVPEIMPEESEVPWAPIAGVGAVGVAGLAYYLTRPAYSYETYEYEVEDGLMEDEDYEDYDEEDDE
jgi:hypothetical protein